MSRSLSSREPHLLRAVSPAQLSFQDTKTKQLNTEFSKGNQAGSEREPEASRGLQPQLPPQHLPLHGLEGPGCHHHPRPLHPHGCNFFDFYLFFEIQNAPEIVGTLMHTRWGSSLLWQHIFRDWMASILEAGGSKSGGRQGGPLPRAPREGSIQASLFGL